MKTSKLRLTAIAMAVLLFLSPLLPCVALAADSSVISIRSGEDLVRLARNCSLDTWSQGKTVTLEADIDLRGTNFSPIPTFGGTFEGNGHTISGLSLREGVSYQGLFRYIQESGVVRDLKVRGTVTASGAQSYLGGIAGSNEGTIMDCAFQGTVEGKEQVGGIAGINQAAGTIYRCTVEGTVTGEKSTGGIAGQNGGAITGCTNRASVNTVHPEKDQTLEDSLDNLNREEVLDTTTDTGGIAGFSNGVLRSCRNEGDVGYAHVGYNVGGVAGRSSGYLENCSNAGLVNGRKDVGGVAGQIAPNIRLIFTPDTIDQLRDELDRLNDMVNRTLDHTDKDRNTISGRLDQISDYAQSATDNADRLADIMSGWADSSIDTVNDAADTLADTLDRLEEITAGGGDILDTVADSFDRLESSMDSLADAMDISEDAMDDLADGMDLLRTALRQAKSAFSRIQQALKTLSGLLILPDEATMDRALEQLRSGSRDLSAALKQCGDALEAMASVLGEGELDDPELQEALYWYWPLVVSGLGAASLGVEELGQGIADMAAGVSLDWGAVRKSADDLAAAMDRLSDSCGTLMDSMVKLRDAFSRLSDLSDSGEDAMTELSDAAELLERATRDLRDTADQLHDLFDDLSNREPIEFDKLGEEFHQAEDDLHSAFNGLGDQMDLLRKEVSTTGDTLSGDIRDLGDQFQAISNLLLDAVSDHQDTESGDLWDDVSQEQIDSTTLGKVRGCSNSGTVEGDLNVGGIAGTMSVEVDFDPEDDVTEVGNQSFDFRYETRAILQECVNTGSVTAKKDGAGGVLGRMELGYILDCENYGLVESTSGDYTGGIAGTARSTIRGCWSKCTLSGRNYVGGIAGYGYEIYQCVSLVAVEDFEGYTGSVAGDWDRTDGALKGNRFVEGHLAGVDGISYAGQAEPVAYADLIQEEGVPEPFHSLNVTYVSENQVVETVSYSYGQPLSAGKIPDVPKKEGYYGVWEEIGEDRITIDHVVDAVYTPYITTLSSEAMRNSVHPVLLVEGIFDAQAAMDVEQIETDNDMERWTVTLTGTGEGAHRVRFTPPGEWKNVSLSLVTEQGKEPVQWERDGSCCVFTVDSASFTIEVVRQGASFPVLWVLLAVGVCAAAGLVCIIIIRKRKAKQPQSVAAAGSMEGEKK